MKAQLFCRTSLQLILLLGLMALPARGQGIDDLGNVQPFAVSADGSVVVGAEYGGDADRAFRWTQADGLQILQDSSVALGISGNASIVVGSGSGFGWQWTEEDGLVKLPEPSSNRDDAGYSATAVSVHEGAVTVVGSIQYDEVPTFRKVVRWRDGGGAELLNDGIAWSISQDGSVIGGTWHDGEQETAVRWVNGGMQVLGGGQARAVSADGSATVGWDEENRPVRWSAGGIQTLSDDGGVAWGVSGDGSVVVGEDQELGGAFIWTAEDGMRLLRDVLTEDYNLDVAGFDFSGANAISADGNVIVGYGVKNAAIQGWRVVLCRTVAWDETSGGSFTEAANWEFESVPDSMSTALFDTGDAYTVSFDEDAENNALDVAEGTDVTLDLGAGTYTLSAGCSAPSAAVDAAYLDLRDGTVEAVDAVELSGTDPVLDVSAGATLVVDSDEDGTGCLVADGAEGSEALVAVAIGGKIASHACSLFGEEAGTTGRLVLDGVLGEENDARFDTDTLVVGGDGDGTVELYSSHLFVEGVAYMAVGEGSSARMTVEELGTFGSWDSLDVGVAGTAELRITNTGIVIGGDVGVEDALSLLVLGRKSSGDGKIFIEENGNFQNSDAVIGLDGDGRMEIRRRGSVLIRRIWIGGHLEGTMGEGVVYVEGEGSVLKARRIWVGRGFSGGLLAQNGGRVEADRIVVYGITGQVVEGEGGTIDASILQVGRDPAAGKHAQVDEHGIVTDTLLLVGEGASLQADTLLLHPGGVVGGSGTFPQPLANTAVVAPGDSAGTVGTFRAGAGYAQDASGVLEIELGGTAEGEYDALSVSGTAELGGTLRLTLLNGYRPEVGHTFEIVTAEAITGAFAQIDEQEGIVAAVTYGEAAVTVTLTEVTSTPVEEPAEELPTAYVLEQNYPNPFNPSTTIRYALPEPAQVRLTVFDAYGREVERPVDEVRPAGRHTVVFRGGVLASGVYFYRLRAGTFEEVRKMLLVK